MNAQLLCCAILMLPPALASQDGAETQERRVLLLVDSSRGWYSGVADKVIHLLREGSPAANFQIARFDYESAAPGNGLKMEAAAEAALDLPPRTPLRDAMSTSIERLSSAETRGTLVVVVHEESYQSWISSRRLEDSAQTAEIVIHSIHFATRPKGDRVGFFRRIGRAIGTGFVWLLDRFHDEPGASHGETAKLLRNLAEYTGGYACEAADEQEALECAEHISSLR